MRYTEFGAQNIADAVARAHRHPAGERAHGQPRAHLAVESRCEVVRLCLDASHSGVCTVIAGSSTTALGTIRGWRSNSFTFVRSSVTPAMALNSPPDRVVGTLICRTLGGFIRGGPTIPSGRVTGRSMSIASGERISLERHI